jgi:hypothetical protein
MSALRSLTSPLLLLGAALGSAACGTESGTQFGVSTFDVVVTKVNGGELPTAEKPLAANRGDREEVWDFTITARSGTGEVDTGFNGFVRVSVNPGAVDSLAGAGVRGRNVLVQDGKAAGTVRLQLVYGPARLWVEDLGYLPAPAGRKPACSNGKDDNDNKLIDFPSDPGCFAADDDTEDGGSYAAGVSPPVHYALPRISDVRGPSGTPYPYDAIEVKADPPQELVVTRVSSDGFYVTDVAPDQMKAGFNSLFAFNFATPPFMRVCDRVSYLAGTANVFFGFTELSFPSYRLTYPHAGDTCLVPEPTVIDPQLLADAPKMKALESSLGRIAGYRIGKFIGPALMKGNKPAPGQSNCDFNGNGQIDYTTDLEGSCSNACTADPDCSEWTEYSARSTFKMALGEGPNAAMILANLSTAPGYSPTVHAGETITALTGTLRYFSGGSLNWTIEARCPDDLVCKGDGCQEKPLSSQVACVRLRSADDNDQGTN